MSDLDQDAETVRRGFLPDQRYPTVQNARAALDRILADREHLMEQSWEADRLQARIAELEAERDMSKASFVRRVAELEAEVQRLKDILPPMMDDDARWTRVPKLRARVAELEDIAEQRRERMQQLTSRITELEAQAKIDHAAALARIAELEEGLRRIVKNPPPMGDDGGVDYEAWWTENDAIARFLLGEEA